MECDIGDVSGTPCIHTQSCHHYRPSSVVDVEEDVVAAAMYKVRRDGTISFVQWGCKKTLEQALTRK